MAPVMWLQIIAEPECSGLPLCKTAELLELNAQCPWQQQEALDQVEAEAQEKVLLGSGRAYQRSIP